jgi:hypothetical protein
MTCCLIKHRYSFTFQLSLFYLPIFLLRIFISSLTAAICTLSRISYRFAHFPCPGLPFPISESLTFNYDLLFSLEGGVSMFLRNASTSTKIHLEGPQRIVPIVVVEIISNFSYQVMILGAFQSTQLAT